jgi:hypothetical protein
MVSFLLYIGFGLRRFGNVGDRKIFVRLSPPLQNRDLTPGIRMSDER